MCDFPSWIEMDGGTVLYLTDADLKGVLHVQMHDAIGHHTIREQYPGCGGREREDFPCPPAIAASINAGHMRRMMRAGGYVSVHVNANGELHREDGPAIECANGNNSWYRNGELHREDGPAIECANGTKYWYRNGELHREDGPAIEYANGNKHWYRNGERQLGKEQ